MKCSAPLFAVLAFACAPSGRAQNILLTLVGGRVAPVQSVTGNVAYAKIDGGLQSARGSRLFLHKTPFYRAGAVRVEGLDMTVHSLDADGSSLNVELTLVCDLTASVTMNDCFIAFEMLDEKGATRQIGLIEVPGLAAGKKQPVRALLKLQAAPEQGHYVLHVFSDRLECLTSLMGPNYIFGKTTAGDLAATAKRDPAPLMGISPKYPPSLIPRAVSGQAMIACLVGPQGDVLEASVAQPGQAEFDQAALEAVRQWIFIPAVQDHAYVAEKVVIPFHFKPPAAASG